MSFGKYHAFLAVSETHSFSKAAAKLGYTQSGVTHLIHTLEDDLGLVLFNRVKSGIRLTQEGDRLLPYIMKLLFAEDEIASVASELRGLSIGTLKIGSISSISINMLPALLKDFSDLYPGIEIQITSGTYSDIENDLLESRINCGFVTTPTRKEFSTIPFFKDRLMMVIPDIFPFVSYSSNWTELLSNYPFIMPAEGSHYMIGELFKKLNFKPNVQFDMKDDYTAVAMVSKGFGLTILPELMVNSLPLQHTKAIPIEDTERNISLAINSTRYIEPATKAFVQFLKQTLIMNYSSSEVQICND